MKEEEPGESRRARRPGEDFERRLEARQKRKLRALREGDNSVWFGFGMFGLVGWAVSVPAVALTALGVWLDSVRPAPFSWTLTLLVVGIFFGCLNAWRWISKERKVIERERMGSYEEEGNGKSDR